MQIIANRCKSLLIDAKSFPVASRRFPLLPAAFPLLPAAFHCETMLIYASDPRLRFVPLMLIHASGPWVWVGPAGVRLLDSVR
jgi:hypothetical protein